MFTPRNNAPKVKVLPELMPKILVALEAIIKMKYIVSLSEDEVGWFGTVYPLQNNGYLIDNVYLFKQEVHSTTCEITPEGLTEFAQEYIDKNDLDTLNRMQLWGHSHVDMSVGASGQDDSQMETFKDSGHDWFIRVIANKKGDMEFTLYDFKAGIIYEDVPWGIFVPNEDIVSKEIEKELKEKVSKISGGFDYNSCYGVYGEYPWNNMAGISVVPYIRDSEQAIEAFGRPALADIGFIIDRDFLDKDNQSDMDMLAEYIEHDIAPLYSPKIRLPLAKKELEVIYETAWKEYMYWYDIEDSESLTEYDDADDIDELTKEVIDKAGSGDYNIN